MIIPKGTFIFPAYIENKMITLETHGHLLTKDFIVVKMTRIPLDFYRDIDLYISLPEPVVRNDITYTGFYCHSSFISML